MASLQAYQSHGHRYYRIVESFRQDGKPRLRVVAHLGRVEDILRLTQDERADIKVSSVTSGAVTALHHLAQELDIAGKIDHALEASDRRVQKRDGLSVGQSLLAGMISRACAPRSKRRSEEHTSELQSLRHLVCRLLLEKKITILLV